MTKENEKETSTELEVMDFDEGMLAEMAADGQELGDNISSEDLQLPRIRILQALSKEVQPQAGEYIKGAKAGDFVNTLSGEIIDGDIGFKFIPIKRRVVYIEWTDRTEGGGMVNFFGEDSTLFDAIEPDETGKVKPTPTTEIVKTWEVFGYRLSEDNSSVEEVLMNFSKTGYKKMKKFNSLIRLCNNPKTLEQFPEFAGVYRFTSVGESKDDNFWFNYDVTRVGFTLAIPEIGKMIYDKSKQLRKDYAEVAEKAKEAYATVDDTEVAEEDNSDSRV